MLRRLFWFALLLCGLALAPGGADANPGPGACWDIPMPGGATARYCMPNRWNGHLVVYARGTVAASEPLGFYQLTAPGDIYLPDLMMALGYAFATTTFRTNGLNTLEAVEDLRILAERFPAVFGRAPRRTLLVAVSLGASPAAIALERFPHLFHGGYFLSGPVGSMRVQLDYLFHVRAVYDYYFPGVLPGSITNVPPGTQADWSSVHEPSLRQAVLDDPARAFEMLRVLKIPHDPGDPVGASDIFERLLWYHVFGWDDAIARLGGVPFDNTRAVYTGSSNDAALNAGVPRVAGSPAAQRALLAYENTARPSRPVLILHNIGDETVPFAQAALYQWRAQRNGRGRFVTVEPVPGLGHVNMSAAEILRGFLRAAELAGAGLAPARELR